MQYCTSASCHVTAPRGALRPNWSVFAPFNQPRICSTCQPPIYLIFWLCIVHITICLAEVSVSFDDVLLLNDIFPMRWLHPFFGFFFYFFPMPHMGHYINQYKIRKHSTCTSCFFIHLHLNCIRILKDDFILISALHHLLPHCIVQSRV